MFIDSSSTHNVKPKVTILSFLYNILVLRLYIMCTNAIYKLYYCILFFSLSQHKANTTELHSKVRQTC